MMLTPCCNLDRTSQVMAGLAMSSWLRIIELTDAGWHDVYVPTEAGANAVLTDVYISPHASGVDTLVDIGFAGDAGDVFVRYHMIYEGIKDHLGTKLICEPGKTLRARRFQGNQHIWLTATGYIAKINWHM